jgi:hypothetical protein
MVTALSRAGGQLAKERNRGLSGGSLAKGAQLRARRTLACGQVPFRGEGSGFSDLRNSSGARCRMRPPAREPGVPTLPRRRGVRGPRAPFRRRGAGKCPLGHLDGLVLARSAYHHSMNYRCVVIFGQMRELLDPAEKAPRWRRLWSGQEGFGPDSWREELALACPFCGDVGVAASGDLGPRAIRATPQVSQAAQLCAILAEMRA